MTAQLPSKVRLAQIASFSKSMALPPSHDEIEAMARALLEAYEQEPVVNDAMALAFHHAITDGSASRDDLDEIKTGLRAALANYPRPAPSIPVPPVAQPVMFIDGDISSEDAEKLAKVIREFNEEDERPLAKMARIIRENPHPTNECDMLKNKPAPVPDAKQLSIADALESLLWPNMAVGNKAVIQAAIDALRTKTAPVPAVQDNWKGQLTGTQCTPESVSKLSAGTSVGVAPVHAVPDEDPRDAFERAFPIPKYAERCGDGYCTTAYDAWDAHKFIQKWEGWNACRAAMLNGGKS